jgi:Ala-tRNA(Pro) deacylase
MKEVYNLLDGLGIKYEIFDHPAVFTVEEARKIKIDGDFGESKNLFLRNKKGDKHYLVVMGAFKPLDLKKLGEIIGEKNLSFASPDRLLKHLKLTPGSVSPFGLINDTNKEVTLILDKDFLKNPKLGLHPNTNTQTIVLKTSDFLKVIESIGNTTRLEDL